MNSSPALPRRQFLTQTALAGAALAFAPRPGAADDAPAGGRFPLIVFNKPFQKLNFDDTADVVAEVGWSGIECPVRAKGQILPEAVEELEAAKRDDAEGRYPELLYMLGSAYARLSPPRRQESLEVLKGFRARVCKGAAAARFQLECETSAGVM